MSIFFTSRIRVLVVDDDAQFLKSSSTVLSALNYKGMFGSSVYLHIFYIYKAYHICFTYISKHLFSLSSVQERFESNRARRRLRANFQISHYLFLKENTFTPIVYLLNQLYMNCGASKIPSLRKQSLIIFSIFFHPIQHQPPLLFWISHNTCHSSLCSDHLRKPYFCTSSSHQKQARCRPHQRFQRCGLRLRFPRKCGVKSWHTGPLL